jgi:uncharacterized membrane protein
MDSDAPSSPDPEKNQGIPQDESVKSNGSPAEPLLPLRQKPLQRLRNYFLTGVVVTAPIGITVYLTWLFIDSIDNLIRPLIPARYSPETYLPFGLPGFGVIVVFLFITLLGALTANFLGRALLGFGERIVNRMPVIRAVYGTLKQIFETVIAQSSNSFKEVVLFEYPRKGLWALGFVTSETTGEIPHVLGEEVVGVFLPTTPTPTSGYLLFMPRRELITLSMSVEDAMKQIISAGIVAAPEFMPPQPD